MQKLDRYIFMNFCKVLVICTISLTGLFIIIDCFANLEEFVSTSKASGQGMLPMILDYYGARFFTLFDRISGLMAVVAGIFVIAMLRRNNELAAIQAGGIPLIRIIRPIVIGVVIVAILGVLNRELIIPAQRDKLVRNAQNWMGEKEIQVRPHYDHLTGISIGARSAIRADHKILSPTFRLPSSMGSFSKKIIGGYAEYQAATNDRPAGYLVSEVNRPENPEALPDVMIEEHPVILSPRAHPDLDPNQLFVCSLIDFKQMTTKPEEHQLESTVQLVQSMQNPSLDYSAQTRVTVHARFVQPFLDIAMLFLALPLVIAKNERNIFVSVGMTLLVIVAFFVISITSHGLGGYGFISAALGAWLPLIAFFPFAVIGRYSLT